MRHTTRRRAVLATVLALSGAGAVAPSALAREHGHDAEYGYMHHGYGRDAIGRYGATFLTVNQGTLDALGSLNISATPIRPARAYRGGSFAFPITDGPAAVASSGVITHAGGIDLSKGLTNVALTDFDISTQTATLSGLVNGTRADLFALDFSKASTSSRDGRTVTGPVSASLTSGAAQALDNAFGTSAFTSGAVVGTAYVVEHSAYYQSENRDEYGDEHSRDGSDEHDNAQVNDRHDGTYRGEDNAQGGYSGENANDGSSGGDD